MTQMQTTLRKIAALALAALLASCAGTPGSSGKITDYSKVRVSGSVERDFQRSLEHLAGEQYSEAIELLQSVVERERRLPAPYVNLGIAYYKNGNEKHAEETLQQALELDPAHPTANNELGVLYRRQGRFAEARKVYVTALANNPEYSPLVKNLGILCDLYLQDLECALAQFQQYMALEPEDDEVPIWVAGLKRRTGG